MEMDFRGVWSRLVGMTIGVPLGMAIGSGLAWAMGMHVTAPRQAFVMAVFTVGIWVGYFGGVGAAMKYGRPVDGQ